MSGDPVDVGEWFTNWLSVDVVACRALGHDPLQRALIEQARGILGAVDRAMRDTGLDQVIRTTVLARVFSSITERDGTSDIDYHL